MANPRRWQSQLALLASAVAVSMLLTITMTNNLPSFQRNGGDDGAATQGDRRQLGVLNLANYKDPKRVQPRLNRPLRVGGDDQGTQPAVEAGDEQSNPVDRESRSRCQIVYIMGVEGATHHGFIPILENLAKNQADPKSGEPYAVDSDPQALKAGLFGWYKKYYGSRWGFRSIPDVDDPEFVKHVVEESCPDDGRRHVLIEWASFPSGHLDDHRSYRVKRQHEWLGMTPEEVADSDEARAHPTSVTRFYRAYSPLADVRFVVLHRPYLETIASHRDWDGGPEAHSNIIRGFMLVLRRFLDAYAYDPVDGRRSWSLVCVERIMAKNYGNEGDAAAARASVLSHLADFLGWPNGECPRCFDDWHESSKDPIAVLGEENVEILRGHMEWLEGVWPPPGEEGVDEQRCGMANNFFLYSR